MTTRKKISFTLITAFIAIQFMQPARNISGQVLPTDISKTVAIRGNVQDILRTACYDCHSNNTRYPWYSRIQPVGWWLDSHINEGKEALNFSEFGSYSPRRQISKFREMEGSIRDGSMPLSSYTLIHRKAQLTKEDKDSLMAWIQNAKDSLNVNAKIFQ